LITGEGAEAAERASRRKDRRRRAARPLHPIAWWVWAIGLAVAVTRTTNPLLLVLVLAVLAFVVTARRTEAPWARAFKYYLGLALVVIALRVLFRSVFGGGIGPTDQVLVRLPELPLPGWLSGVQLGGPVSLEGTVAAAVDGLRLGCLLCCVGAANALANPKRALRVLPGALYELGVAVVVSISVAPQLVESVQRVRRARRLRAGRTSGFRALRSVAIPVLEDALERSIRLAAAMDGRGYGRVGRATPASRRATAVLLVLGLGLLCAGAYGLLDATAPRLLGLPALLAGAAASCAGLAVGSRRVTRTTYRPDPWRWPEWAVCGCGLVPAVTLIWLSGVDAAALNPPFAPLAWPPLPALGAAAVMVAALAGVAAPPPLRPPAPRPPARRTPAAAAPSRDRVPA
jgi:energy-coupling factor transport system permease protein